MRSTIFRRGHFIPGKISFILVVPLILFTSYPVIQYRLLKYSWYLREKENREHARLAETCSGMALQCRDYRARWISRSAKQLGIQLYPIKYVPVYINPSQSFDKRSARFSKCAGNKHESDAFKDVARIIAHRLILKAMFHDVTVTTAIKEYDQSDAPIILTLREHQHACIDKYVHRPQHARPSLSSGCGQGLRVYVYRFTVSPIIMPIMLHGMRISRMHKFCYILETKTIILRNRERIHTYI